MTDLWKFLVSNLYENRQIYVVYPTKNNRRAYKRPSFCFHNIVKWTVNQYPLDKGSKLNEHAYVQFTSCVQRSQSISAKITEQKILAIFSIFCYDCYVVTSRLALVFV